MNQPEMVTLLAKVQLGDNRNVDRLTVDYWMDTIGDLPFDVALTALRRFRRERPGIYLEPGHLLELAGIAPEPVTSLTDVTDEVLADDRARMLAAAGVTDAEYAAHEHDVEWVRAKFGPLLEQRTLSIDVKGFDE